MIHICIDCSVELNGRNTKGLWREKMPKSLRCGSCYLKWRREIRRSNGER